MNVLLVDDEPTLRKMAKLILQSRGFEVFDAPNGAEALVLAQDHPIDLLVTDVVMPGMDGWTLARSLVERNPMLPIVFISGFATDFEKAGRPHTRCTFLAKPFRKTDLLNALAEVL